MNEVVREVLLWVSAHPHWSYFVVGSIAFFESLAFVGLFFPGALIMFGTGALVASGTMAFWPAFSVAVIGAIAGDGISYWFGRCYGDRVRHVWPFRRHPEMLSRCEGFFERHGGRSIVMGRFVGPIRPVIPVVAGIMKMPPKRFYIANILSAVVWAPAYLLPGMAFGTALTLAGEVAARLAALVCIVTVIMGGIVWLVRFAYHHVVPHAVSWSASLTTWGQQRRGIIRLIADLFDPEHQPNRVLLAWLAILIAGTWLFFGVLEDVLTRDQLVFAGQSVYEFLQQLRTPLGDRVMVALTELGDGAVIAPLIITVVAWFLIRRRWRDLAYWLAVIGGGGLILAVLKGSLQIPRPVELNSGVSAFSFPSGHATMSVVVYGFLAAFIAPALSSRMRMALYGAVGVLIGGIAFSRLYLGAHWLADIAGGLGIGSAWVALLTIARRHHGPGTVATRPFGVLMATVFLLAAAGHIHGQFSDDLERYAVRHPIREVKQQEWWQTAWSELPAYRLDLEGEHEQPLNVQFAGDLVRLKEHLKKSGWREPVRVSPQNALLWIAPSPIIGDLPVLPKLHNGRSDELCLIHAGGEPTSAKMEQLILRLWPANVRLLPSNQPLWIGYVGQQRIQRLPFLSIARSGIEYDKPMAALRSALWMETAVEQRQRNPSEQENRSYWDGQVMLIESETRF